MTVRQEKERVRFYASFEVAICDFKSDLWTEPSCFQIPYAFQRRDLAELYAVEARALNQAVKRNLDRFPEDFMFQLGESEYESLRSQTVILKTSRGRGQHRKYFPLVFTEQGVAMLSSVLKSKQAVQVNITIIRAFVKLREMLETNKELAEKIDQLERKFLQHDQEFKAVFEAIRQLMAVSSPMTPKRIKGLSKE